MSGSIDVALSPSKPEDEDPPKAVRATYAAVCLVVAAGVLLAITATATGGELAKMGVVGDFLGGHLAGLGNVAAFLLMYAALLYQRQELKLQREELRLTRDEMRLARQEAAKAAAAQELLAGKQDELIGAQRDLADAGLRELDRQNFASISGSAERLQDQIRNRVRWIERHRLYLERDRNMPSRLRSSQGGHTGTIEGALRDLSALQPVVDRFQVMVTGELRSWLDECRRMLFHCPRASGEDLEAWRVRAQEIAQRVHESQGEFLSQVEQPCTLIQMPFVPSM